MSVTLKELLDSCAEEYALGMVGTTTSTGDTTSIIDATRFARPFAGNKFARNTPLRITARAAVVGGGITIGAERFVSDFAPATGDFTVSTAFNDAPEIGTEFIVLYSGVADSTDRLVEALNRFLTRVARKRERVVLTQAGRAATLLGTTSLWTTSNATLTYTAGDPSDYQLRRYLRVAATAGDGYATPGSFSVEEDEVYDFFVPVVWPITTAEGRVEIWDMTATAQITPTYYEGSAAITGANRQAVRGYFTVPADCRLVQVRYVVDAISTVVRFGPCYLQRRDTYTIPAPAEIDSIQQLGQVFTIDNLGGTTPRVPGTSDNWVEHPVGYGFDQRGFANIITAQTPLPFPCAIEADVHYDEITAGDPTGASAGTAASESDTTDCPRELALKGMALEFFKWAQRRDRHQRGPDNHATRWDGMVNDAEAAMVTAQVDKNAPKKITVRKHFSGHVRA